VVGEPSPDHEGELGPWAVVSFQGVVYLIEVVKEQAVEVEEETE
jgi:hypothetical protein